MYHRKWVMAVITAVAFVAHYLDSSHALYLLQTLVTLALVYVALSKSRQSSFLLFFTTLFILGNWFKLSAHKIVEYRYVEPAGAFAGTSDEWDRYYECSIAITLALIAAKLARDFFLSRAPAPRYAPRIRPPSKLFFYFSGALVVLIYGLNVLFGFYRIGLGQGLDLPFGLNAPASFLVFLGAPMLIAVAATNSVMRRRRITIGALLAIAVLTLVGSVTMYSRATVAIVLVPIVMGLYQSAYWLTGRKQSLKPLALVGGVLLVSVALVSIARIYAYSDGGGTLNAASIEYYIGESSGLFIDRWVGVEGLMTAVSSNQSLDLFFDMLSEDPKNGVNSFYQALSGSSYVQLIDKTFLTLPGAFAILAFSGSTLVILVGVMLMCAIGFSVEAFVKLNFPWSLALQYLVSANVAYHFSQMVFPYLLIPFLVQLAFFLAALKLYAPGGATIAYSGVGGAGGYSRRLRA